MAEIHPTMSRRSLLAALALGPMASGLASPAWAASAAAEAGLIAANVCRLAPELTEGPYFFDLAPERSDVTEGRPGAPLDLALQVVDAGCAPIAGARVDLWSCDARGVYSGTAAAPDATFLRGAQATDADGIVRFRTIWPGWYPGRTPHLHYKVRLGGGWTLTSQIFLPDALSAAIYEALPAYAGRTERGRVPNGEDRIAVEAGAGAFAAVDKRADHYDASLVVGVDPDAPPPAREGRVP